MVSRLEHLLAEKVVRQGGNERARQDIRGDQRKDHGFGERTKQITGDATQSEHRHESDADAQQ